MAEHVDVVVVGSGFGGSVAALRLAEKGYSVLVLEAGRWFDEATYPRTSWRLRRFLWAPALKCFGLQRIHVLRDVVVLAGAGVGGGSLVYANTLYVPPKQFFEDPQWAHITDWAAELAPYYDQASRMLGVVDNPLMTRSDEIMKAVADDMGVGHTFRLTPVGVYFGDGPGVQQPDPFFGGVGPARTGCTHCGECMTGCRHGAKNTLVKNYLHLAQAAGARIQAMTTVHGIREHGDGYAVDVVRTGSWTRRGRQTITCDQVIVAAGTYGTQRLLHRMRDTGSLPRLSPALGRLSRTNSESILGAVARSAAADYTQGVAITSSFYPEPSTHVEPVRYGKGSNAMGLLQSVISIPVAGVPRWRSWTRALWRQRGDALRLLNVRRWSERAVISLVMQPVDNSLTLTGQRSRLGRWRLTTKQSESTPAPTYIPAAVDVVERVAAKIDGIAGSNVFENVDAAMTAHFVGGCVIGDDPTTSVIDPYHRVWGHPGIHVVDGSAITANLGVNPSLTITAQAERAFALWPNRGETDPRPAPGAYERIAPVPPRRPVVPQAAPGALRLPLLPSH